MPATTTITEEKLENTDGSLDVEAANKFLAQVSEAEKANQTPADHSADADTAKPGDKPAGDVKEEDVQPDTAKPDTGDEWFTAEDVRDLVETLGLSKEDLAEFSGRDELDRHVKLLDRQFMKAGKEVVQRDKPGENDQSLALQAIEEAKGREEQRERAAKQPRENGRFTKPAEDDLPKLDPDEFDERLVKAMDARDQRIRQLEERLLSRDAEESQSRHRMMQARFDSIVDQLGHDELFGKSEELKPGTEPFKQRAKLWDAMSVLAAGMESRGRPVTDISQSLIVRAFNQEFAGHVQKQTQQQFASRIRKQAARRFGGGQQVSLPRDADPDKALIAAYHAMDAEGL